MGKDETTIFVERPLFGLGGYCFMLFFHLGILHDSEYGYGSWSYFLCIITGSILIQTLLHLGPQVSCTMPCYLVVCEARNQTSTMACFENADACQLKAMNV
ncbi:uncharacterized protein K460DRAFT_6801 [Cucurbitaria berberidis CBS 394.84]|uniref:Uncharacterized protein n=1 Tax=Cucurbitaria berberidis CBS 394.84 TaxID=1168544 RepID=A0A9P4LCQ0_9PLEO|nr:uncharacterized protein K460DRAFT_6801 [Cucurbitaria berberidis CBS 394.84]KAF1849923.1 hypothetical protein K460DRAFT_6801 [Cucurbitaria berberidis CBS 394.84]